MRVLLTTAVDHAWSRTLLEAVRTVARADRFGEHDLVTDADEADLIIIVDPHQHPGDPGLRAIRHHPLVRAFPSKVFVYDERDVPRDSLPGIYVAMPRRRFDERRQRAFGYYTLQNDTRTVVNEQPDLLFSFQGRRVGAVRASVLALSHSRAIVEDTSEHDFFATRQGLDAARRSYRDLMGRSKFVLCPRGAGASSLRLFETLACGRVPVVLSDAWQPPKGVDWRSCSVCVPEREAHTVAERLEALEPLWPEMSAAAKQTYEEWFAPEVWFHRAVEHCRELQEAGARGTTRQWLSPEVWRDHARHWKGTLRSPRARPPEGVAAGREAGADT